MVFFAREKKKDRRKSPKPLKRRLSQGLDSPNGSTNRFDIDLDEEDEIEVMEVKEEDEVIVVEKEEKSVKVKKVKVKEEVDLQIGEDMKEEEDSDDIDFVDEKKEKRRAIEREKRQNKVPLQSSGGAAFKFDDSHSTRRLSHSNTNRIEIFDNDDDDMDVEKEKKEKSHAINLPAVPSDPKMLERSLAFGHDRGAVKSFREINKMANLLAPSRKRKRRSEEGDKEGEAKRPHLSDEVAPSKIKIREVTTTSKTVNDLEKNKVSLLVFSFSSFQWGFTSTVVD